MIKSRLVFGVPKKRVTKKRDKYPDTAVLTVYPTPEKGGGYKFELNKKAIEILNLEGGVSKVSVAFKSNGNPSNFLANVTKVSADIEQGNVFNLTKQGTFSNSKLHEKFVELFELDDTKINEFILNLDLDMSAESNIEIAEITKMTTINQLEIPFEEDNDKEDDEENTTLNEFNIEDNIDEEEVLETNQEEEEKYYQQTNVF